MSRAKQIVTQANIIRYREGYTRAKIEKNVSWLMLKNWEL